MYAFTTKSAYALESLIKRDFNLLKSVYVEILATPQLVSIIIRRFVKAAAASKPNQMLSVPFEDGYEKYMKICVFFVILSFRQRSAFADHIEKLIVPF